MKYLMRLTIIHHSLVDVSLIFINRIISCIDAQKSRHCTEMLGLISFMYYIHNNKVIGL